jgi:hypothetical protein
VKRQTNERFKKNNKPKTEPHVMKTQVASLILLLANSAAFAQGTLPSRVEASLPGTLPYSTSGVLLRTLDSAGSTMWRGSGTVAASPKTVVACAHSVYGTTGWLANFQFVPAHNSASYPGDSANRQMLRSYKCWASYNGGNPTYYASFAEDLVVHYSYTNVAGGSHSRTWSSDSTTNHPLNSGSTPKLMVGYPQTATYYMNKIGSFVSPFTSVQDHFFATWAAESIPGMSGGGAFAQYNYEWYLAGVIVSGSPGTGVRALDSRANNLINSAIVSSNVVNSGVDSRTLGMGAGQSVPIPDNRTSWSSKAFYFNGMPTKLVSATVSVDITHPYRGDLEVKLTAPSGRSMILLSRSGGSADNVEIAGQNVMGTFGGSNPNGVWTVSVRDLAPADTGKLNFCSVTLGASKPLIITPVLSF